MFNCIICQFLLHTDWDEMINPPRPLEGIQDWPDTSSKSNQHNTRQE